MVRRVLGFAVVLVGLAALPALADPKAEGFASLFNGKDLSGWKAFADPKSKEPAEKQWKVEGDTIVCDGTVNGYLGTEKEYSNYVLRLQWRWGARPSKVRNSGVLVHATGPDKIWPKSVEAQLKADFAGDFWTQDGFRITVDPARKDPASARHFLRMKGNVEKPVGEWNQYEITCQGKTITLAINGQVVNVGTEAESERGRILLQSEGAEVHFRNVEIKQLP